MQGDMLNSFEQLQNFFVAFVEEQRSTRNEKPLPETRPRAADRPITTAALTDLMGREAAVGHDASDGAFGFQDAYFANTATEYNVQEQEDVLLDRLVFDQQAPQADDAVR